MTRVSQKPKSEHLVHSQAEAWMEYLRGIQIHNGEDKKPLKIGEDEYYLIYRKVCNLANHKLR